MVYPPEIENFVNRLPRENGQLHILTAAGIGDLAWTYSKWHAVCAERDVTFWFPETEPHRAGPLAAMYGVRCGYMPNLTTQMVWDYHDRYGDPQIPDTGGALIVSPNRHLENGRRIERWYPSLPFRNPAPRTTATTYKLAVSTLGYVVVAMGERDYMEGNLMPGQWARILKEIERTVAPVVIVAGMRSGQFAREVMRHWDPTLPPIMDGRLEELVAVFARAKAMVGTASGLTILSTYLSTPTLIGYPRWLVSMPGTWEQEGHRSEACYLDALELAVRDGCLSDLLAGAVHPQPRRDVVGGGDDATVSELVSEVDDAGSAVDLPVAAEAVVEGNGVPVLSTAPWLHDPGVRADQIGGRD